MYQYNTFVTQLNIKRGCFCYTVFTTNTERKHPHVHYNRRKEISKKVVTYVIKHHNNAQAAGKYHTSRMQV